MHVIDLRSDTVTRPSVAMRAAMAAADVGDDVFGKAPKAFHDFFADNRREKGGNHGTGTV